VELPPRRGGSVGAIDAAGREQDGYDEQLQELARRGHCVTLMQEEAGREGGGESKRLRVYGWIWVIDRSRREGEGEVADAATWRWGVVPGFALLSLPHSLLFSCCCAPFISVACHQICFPSPLISALNTWAGH
jgi:hypothetical protein